MSSARSRSDPAPLTPDAAAAEIVAAAFRVRDIPRILIDGCSGSGKSTLASELQQLRPDLQWVALDSIYPGWDGLRAGSDRACARVLVPHAAGAWGSWQRWDWAARRGAEEHEVDPAGPLLVEGSGVLTARSATYGDVRVWVEAGAATRRARALARDGAMYEPHWDRWARQEERHVASDQPQRWTTHVLCTE